MPFCPECKSEYVEGFTTCSDCQVPLVPVLEEEIHFSPEDYSLVFSSTQLFEAEMTKTNLESAGIEAYILDQTDRNYIGANNTGLVKIFVKKTDTADAEDFLKNLPTDMQQSEDEGAPGNT